jgi:hypothetical protein
MPKNDVSKVQNISSSLLREFEEAPAFDEPVKSAPIKKEKASAPPASAEQEDNAAVPATKSASKKTSQKKLTAAEVSKEIEAERIARKALNLYLPEDDVKYLKDLARVIGKNPTNILRTWITVHRREKGAQVEEAIKKIESTQNLL